MLSPLVHLVSQLLHLSGRSDDDHSSTSRTGSKKRGWGGDDNDNEISPTPAFEESPSSKRHKTPTPSLVSRI